MKRWCWVLVFLLSACSAGGVVEGGTPVPTEGPSGDNPALAGTQWQLESLGPAGSEALVGAISVTLAFGEGGRLSGTAGCNNYGGSYRVDGGDIQVGEIESTAMACAGVGVMSLEENYLDGLRNAEMFEVSGDRLTIFYDGGQGALHFFKLGP